MAEFKDIKPQRAFDSWTEPLIVTVPLLGYDGTDTGMIEIFLPKEVCVNGSLRLPRTMFSDNFNKSLPEIPDRKE